MSAWKAGVWRQGVWRASVWGCNQATFASAIDGDGYQREQDRAVRIQLLTRIRTGTDDTERAIQDETIRAFIEHHERTTQADTARKTGHLASRNRQRNTTRH